MRFCRITQRGYLAFRQGDGFAKVAIKRFSTLSRAQRVLRKNFSDDLTDGSLLKQLMSILSANPSQS
jgi:hypothetical protein